MSFLKVKFELNKKKLMIVEDFWNGKLNKQLNQSIQNTKVNLIFNNRQETCTQMSIQQKQEYLRNEIVENGFDAQQFYQFWQTFGIDLNNATMDDVVSIVTQFQSSNKKKQDNQDQFGDYVEPVNNQHHHDSNFYQDINWDFLAEKPHENKQHKEKKQENQNKNKKQDKISKKQHQDLLTISPTKSQVENDNNSKVNFQVIPKSKNTKQISVSKQVKQAPLISFDQSNNVNNVTFQEVIKDSKSIKRTCLKLQPNILQHHANVQIFITKYKEITQQSTGIINKLWKGTYLLFTIKTIGRNKQKAIGISWEVQRQHSDFQWLRNIMIKMHPGLVVPPLPVLVKSIDQLNGYQRKLQSFLLDCFNCPQLRNSKYFQVFLSYASAKDFETFKKSCQNTSKPKNLEHVLNMQGEKLDGYSQGLQNFLNKSSQHLKNVKTLIKQIDQFYSSISTKYKQLSDVFTKMSQESCQFSQEECYPKLTETYRQISQLVSQHSYFCMLEKEFLQTFMFSHFAYERDRVENMQSLITRRKTFTTQFAKPKHQVQKPESSGTSVFGKIAGLFGQKTQTIDIPSSDTATLRDQVGYYNSQLLKQSIRCIEGMIASHVNHFSTYGHSRIDNVQEMQKLWSKILVQLSKLSRK